MTRSSETSWLIYYCLWMRSSSSFSVFLLFLCFYWDVFCSLCVSLCGKNKNKKGPQDHKPFVEKKKKLSRLCSFKDTWTIVSSNQGGFQLFLCLLLCLRSSFKGGLSNEIVFSVFDQEEKNPEETPGWIITCLEHFLHFFHLKIESWCPGSFTIKSLSEDQKKRKRKRKRLSFWGPGKEIQRRSSGFMTENQPEENGISRLQAWKPFFSFFFLFFFFFFFFLLYKKTIKG